MGGGGGGTGGVGGGGRSGVQAVLKAGIGTGVGVLYLGEELGDEVATFAKGDGLLDPGWEAFAR